MDTTINCGYCGEDIPARLILAHDCLEGAKFWEDTPKYPAGGDPA